MKKLLAAVVASITLAGVARAAGNVVYAGTHLFASVTLINRTVPTACSACSASFAFTRGMDAGHVTMLVRDKSGAIAFQRTATFMDEGALTFSGTAAGRYSIILRVQGSIIGQPVSVETAQWTAVVSSPPAGTTAWVPGKVIVEHGRTEIETHIVGSCSSLDGSSIFPC